jgi:hypothetical protein
MLVSPLMGPILAGKFIMLFLSQNRLVDRCTILRQYIFVKHSLPRLGRGKFISLCPLEGIKYEKQEDLKEKEERTRKEHTN